ncbi:hypothetical protein F2P81_002626 [Scophthalmus maximus]|uniref:Reverse transcriptase RNase H-like domain-containing protein n=1 Tax=Scophthalmus maximus TaxID=52904 RepID=A0A6A4THD2_SCOMX|nr:hypothetical protein F2P81_002626 [Scophthalmus maximus]
MTTDASLSGWGAVMSSRTVNRTWNLRMVQTQINLLDLWAFFLSLKHFVHFLQGRHVLVKTDNSTVVAYINRQGGTRSLQLHGLARKVILWSNNRLLSLRATYVPGVLNRGADLLSRGNPLYGEWALHPQVVEQIWLRYGQAAVDLFASQEVRSVLLPVRRRRTTGQISLLHHVQGVQLCINNMNNIDNSQDQVLWLKFNNYDNYGSNSGYISETARHAETTVKKPPPYEKEVKFKDIYPQLPVISQEGDYCIRDEDDQIIEIGQAETTIKMNPSSKSKKKMTRLETKGRLRIRKMEFRDDDDRDSEEIMGGYDPVVRRKLERAERRGDEIWKKKNRGDNTSDESENGDGDGDLVNKGALCSRGFYPATYSTRIEEVERSIDRCCLDLDKSTKPEEIRELVDQLRS